jgi:glutamyl-Q tRNA(Asp) synthetase
MADYQTALERLRAHGLVYRCFRTRREIAEAITSAPHGAHEGFRGAPLPPREEAARLDRGEPFAWRLSLEAARSSLDGFYPSYEEFGDGAPRTGRIAADPRPAGDVVLARKDVGVAYHLAVVVDDALQGVTRIVRGADLIDSTPIQRLLQTLLGLPEPSYAHHRLILGPDGRRLAKRDRAETLQAIRARGVTAQDLRNELGFA